MSSGKLKSDFVFQNFTNDDGGVYKVTAKNESGEGTANITINLQGYVCLSIV